MPVPNARPAGIPADAVPAGVPTGAELSSRTVAPGNVAVGGVEYVDPTKCSATRLDGEPCQAHPTANGKCVGHNRQS